MIVEIMLRQTSGYVLRIGSLPGVGLGDRVRIDSREDWIIVRCVPARLGGSRRVECERAPLQRRRAA
jgi:hypothetical protein